MIKTKLKGGSLSATYLCEEDGVKFIRKEVSTSTNREYGFVRWYSQLKKIQRLGNEFPELFPKILKVSYYGQTAYFDIEYFEGYTDVKSLLISGSLSDTQISNLASTVYNNLSMLHEVTFKANPHASCLYFEEEVNQKLIDASNTPEFKNFVTWGQYVYHRAHVPGIQEYLPKLRQFFSSLDLPFESLTHGNPTLENMLYCVDTNKLVFIDLYEESIIDSNLLDFAQVRQCSHSHYGFLNDREVHVYGNWATHDLTIPSSLYKFNSAFEYLLNGLDKRAIDVLEATQFIRMLPFKCMAGDIDKAKFFYVHACYLLGKCFDE
jgi:hypothetical protein